jgi:DNA-binding NarL/FixJ family response regulator
MTRVLIATADAALRNALSLLLRQRLPVSIVGEPSNKADLEAGLVSMQPDLLLVDWALPEFRSPQTLTSYRDTAPQARIVVLSVGVEEIAEVLAAGAHGCLAIGASPDNLLNVLRQYAA